RPFWLQADVYRTNRNQLNRARDDRLAVASGPSCESACRHSKGSLRRPFEAPVRAPDSKHFCARGRCWCLQPRAAGKNRALLETAIMAGGLRASEVTELRWRDVNLAARTITVAKSKTDAGVRLVELDPGTTDVLKEHKATANDTRSD